MSNRDPKMDRSGLYFLSNAWMVPLSLFAMIYFFIKGHILLGVLMVIVLVSAVVRIYQWGKGQKRK